MSDSFCPEIEIPSTTESSTRRRWNIMLTSMTVAERLSAMLAILALLSSIAFPLWLNREQRRLNFVFVDSRLSLSRDTLVVKYLLVNSGNRAEAVASINLYPVPRLAPNWEYDNYRMGPYVIQPSGAIADSLIAVLPRNFPHTALEGSEGLTGVASVVSQLELGIFPVLTDGTASLVPWLYPLADVGLIDNGSSDERFWITVRHKPFRLLP
jgi:hypothetical protein